MRPIRLLIGAMLAAVIGLPVGVVAAQDNSMAQPPIPKRVALPIEGQLPSLAGATDWLNSPPLTPAGLPTP